MMFEFAAQKATKREARKIAAQPLQPYAQHPMQQGIDKGWRRLQTCDPTNCSLLE